VSDVAYRKGELSKAAIDRNWPHQVALPEYRCSGHNYVTIHLFCEGLSLCPRGHFFYRDGIGERTGSWRPSIPMHGDPPFRLMATPRTGMATQPVEGVSGTVG